MVHPLPFIVEIILSFMPHVFIPSHVAIANKLSRALSQMVSIVYLLFLRFMHFSRYYNICLRFMVFTFYVFPIYIASLYIFKKYH